MADKDLLEEAQAEFKMCVDAEQEQRVESQDDLEFALLGKQWPDDIRAKRMKEGRPCLTINRLPAFIKQVTNDARLSRPAITTKPVGGGADTKTSKILNDLIRNIESISSADIAYDTAMHFAATMGFGYWVIRTDYSAEDSFEQDIKIERVANPFSVYGDYESTSATSDDWNRSFITDMYTKEDFEKKWPGAQSMGFDAERNNDLGELWFDEGSLRVAEWWKREEVPIKILKLSDGAVMEEAQYLKIKNFCDVEGISVEGDRMGRSFKVIQRIISGKEVLETNDWAGKYIPIVPVYGDEVNVNGKRSLLSLVRFAKDPQRMFNYWRTTATELVALAPKAPFIGPVGSFATDAAKWQSANTDSHAYLEYDPIPGEAPPQRQPFAGVPAGALQEALSASDDMKNIMGLHDASLGARSNETSGVAINARQREGDVSTFNFVDNRNRAIEHTGRIIVDLIPKVYNTARVLRCIKEDGSTYDVPVNQPVMKGNQGMPPGGLPGPMVDNDGDGDDDRYEAVPEHVEGLTHVFDLTTGKYDVEVKSGPSFTTKREEAATQMMEFLRSFPQAAPLIGDLLVNNLDWPGADQVAERLKAMLPPQIQNKNAPPPAVQQLQGQLQQQDQMAKQAVGQLQVQLQQMAQQMQQLQQQLQDKQAEIALKDRELQIKSADAETKRIQVLGDIEDKRKAHEARVIDSANQAAASVMAAQNQQPSQEEEYGNPSNSTQY